MKIKYEFANEEVIEIEVDEKWGQVVLEFDRQECNNDHTESRRHISLSNISSDSEVFSDNFDVFDEVFSKYFELYEAMDKLEPRQKQLLNEHLIKGYSQTELAKKEGVSITATHNAINRAIKKFKKFYGDR